MSGALTGVRREPNTVEFYVAACTGTAILGDRIGWPVVHVGLATDAATAIVRLNATRHGSGALWPGSFQPFEPQPGWDDWKLFPLERDAGRGLSLPGEAKVEDGLIRAVRPTVATVTELAEQFSGVLAHLRYHDVVRRPEWIETRSDADPLCDLVFHPRYTLRDGHFRNARLVTDLVLLDPAEEGGLLLWMACAAMQAAGGGARSFPA